MNDDTSPRLHTTADAQGAWVQLLGRWGAAELEQRTNWRALKQALSSNRISPDVGWDLESLQWLDHIGAQLLWQHWQHQWPARVRVSEAQRAMIERVAKFQRAPLPQRPSMGLMDRVNQLGLLVLGALGHMRHLVELIGQLVLDLGYLIRHPRQGPWRDFSGHLYNMGAMALPITALVGFLIGVVLAYLMALQLRQFGAETFIVDILGISLVRELGPLLAAILVAGRSGSAITAQIGVMRVTEELDAMQVMGIRHGFRLVMPRAMALALSMPLISLWTTLAALGGGMLASDLTLGISAAYFLETLPSAVSIGNLVLATAKSVVFGVFIALIGCHWGLQVKPNTQSLGAGTTASVVSSITMVIVVDAIFAVAFKNVGF